MRCGVEYSWQVSPYKELVDMSGGAASCSHGMEKELVLMKHERFRLDLKKDFLMTESGWGEHLIHLLDWTSYVSLSLFPPL